MVIFCSYVEFLQNVHVVETLVGSCVITMINCGCVKF